MNKINIALTLCLFSLALTGQPCPDSIYFTSQAQIDSFQIVYPNCTEIEGTVLIDGEDISNLNGLSALSSIGGSLVVGKDFKIGTGNPNLTSLSGLDNLLTIGGDLHIQFAWALSNLEGLDALTLISGDLILTGFNYLVSPDGLGALDYVGGDVLIQSLYTLTNINSLNNVDSIGGALVIEDNEALADINGLSNLDYVGSGVYLTALSRVKNLSGLGSLESVGGSLFISSNDSLLHIADLISLKTINGNLWLQSNPLLASLQGLDDIDPGSITGIYIFNNDKLSVCEVESVCAYLANPSGATFFENNTIGCKSAEEVLDSCEANAVSVDEHHLFENLSISPNPFTTSTTLSFRLEKPENVQFTVYNVQSEIVFEMQERQDKGEQEIIWNAEGLPAGMYFIRLQTGDKIVGRKLLKLKDN